MNIDVSSTTIFPFTAQYTKINGQRMHYVEQGEGDPILCIHGIPTCAYLWRNILPGLSGVGRAMAVDLIGMGKSDKPAIAYTIADHIDYLTGFIDALALERVTLVVHAWGSIVGLAWAMRHPERVKALVFSESHLRPITNWEMISLPLRQLSSALLNSTDDYSVNLKIQDFVGTVLDSGSLNQLSDEAKTHYLAPYTEQNSHLPIRQYIREFPLGDIDNPVVKIVSEYSMKLQSSELPKLLLYAIPGFVATMDSVVWAKEHLPNLKLVDLGEAMHFPQESDPKNFTEAIADWYQTLN